MSYGTIAGALSRGRHSTLRIYLALAAFAAALMLFGALGATNASAAFKATGWSMSPSTTQAGGHPALTLSATLDAAAGDANGDDLRDLQIELPAGMLFNPQAVTPCTTASFNSDKCPATAQIGQISVGFRVAGTNNTATGAIYSITPDSNSVINFGFIVRPTTKFQKFLFQSGRATGLTTVRQGLDKDYGLSVLIPNIPRTIKSTIGTSTAMTISNITMTFNPKTGSTQTGKYFTFAPTRCEGISSQTTFTSYTGAKFAHASGYVATGCDKVGFNPSLELRALNTASGQATGINATVSMDTSDQAIQQSHVKNVAVTLGKGTTVNLGTLNAIPTCSEAQLASDTCPAASKIGTAAVNVPFLPAPMTGSIYLTSTDTIQFAYIIKGARGVVATLRGSAGLENGGVTAKFQMLPQAPWSSANMEFTAQLVNNATYGCPNNTAWAYVDGYSGSSMIYGALYTQTSCPPPDTSIDTTFEEPINRNTPQIYFSSNPATGTTFKCKVDTGAWVACASPYTTPVLADGQHTFAVRAFDAAGAGDYSPATTKFTIDTVKPVINITSPAEGQAIDTASGDVKLEFTTEAGSENFCRLDQGALPSCGTSLTYTNVADGAHRIRVISRDLAGNLAYVDRNFTVRRAVPPTVMIQSPAQNGTFPTNEAKFDFTVTSPSNTAITKITCNFVIRYEEWNYEQEDFSQPCTSGQVFSMDPEASRRLYIVAEDANGQTGTAFVDFTTGIYPPYGPGVVDGQEIHAGRITDRTPKWDLYDRDDGRWPDAIWECSLQPKTAPAVWTPCGSATDPQPFEVTTPLTDGAWRFQARGRSGTIAGGANTMDFTVGDWDATYVAVPSTTQAGAHPDLDVTITPTKAGQFRSIDMTLPRGMIGSLNSFPKCPLASVPTAGCDPSTKIGEVITKVQISGLTSLRPLKGDVFLTEPQVPGDVAGMVINVFGPVEPFADTIIPLRMQLINNAQVMRVFSDSIPVKVGDIDDPLKFTNFWVNEFKLHINGSAGSPYPLLTNPSRCAAGQFDAILGDTEGNKSPARPISWTATGCESLAFAPTITQTFTNPVAGQVSGVVADIELPAGHSTFTQVRVNEPAFFGANLDAFGAVDDQCPASAAPSSQSIFDPKDCPPQSVIGTMSVDSPLLEEPLTGKVYLIFRTPLQWLGVDLKGDGISVRLVGASSLPQVDPGCLPEEQPTGECQTQIQVSFGNLPDLPLSRIRLNLDGGPRTSVSGRQLPGEILTVASPSHQTCVGTDTARTTFRANSAAPNVVADQAVSIFGCLPQ